MAKLLILIWRTQYWRSTDGAAAMTGPKIDTYKKGLSSFRNITGWCLKVTSWPSKANGGISQELQEENFVL